MIRHSQLDARLELMRTETPLVKNQIAPYDPLSVVSASPKRIFASEIYYGIGQEVGANKIRLALSVPTDREPKLLLFDWENGVLVIPTEGFSLSSLSEPIIERVIKGGSEFFEYSTDLGPGANPKGKNQKTVSVAAVPIIYQGVVTGCACFWSRKAHGFTLDDCYKIRQFASAAALVAQWERETTAIEVLNSAIIRWRVSRKEMTNQEALQGIANFLQKIFSLAAVVIDLDVGFKHYIQSSGEIDREKLHDSSLEESLNRLLMTAPELEVVRTKFLDFVDAENVSPKPLVDNLYFIVKKGRDDFPLHGSSYSLLKNIASIVTDAILNALRDRFNVLIKEFALALNDKNLVTYADWFHVIEKTAKGARLQWAAATGVGNHEYFGENESQKVIQKCLERIDAESGDLLPPSVEDDNIDSAVESIGMILLDDPEIGRHRVISVRLRPTKTRLWFGVEREGFGIELSTQSPWTTFIERLSQIAESARLRLEKQDLENEAAETRQLATYAVTSQTVFHQIANMVRDIVNPITSLKEAVAVGSLNANQDEMDLIHLSDKAAASLLDFAFMFMNVNKIDARRPCSLSEVIKKSRELFDIGLKSNQISLDLKFSDDFSLDVPFNVAFLSITNLLSNAKDAIGKRSGKIWIDAENAGDMIHCHIVNNGPPVDPEIRKIIFHKIGVSTKQGQSVRGWGLYLAYRSLIENRGLLELTSSTPRETKFTIRFPRERQEAL